MVSPIKQKSLTEGFERYRKKTRKEQFLGDMEAIIPWKGNRPEK